jgi:hypothetical protein
MPISVGNVNKRKINRTQRYVVCKRKVCAHMWVTVTASVKELSKVTPNLDG